MNPEDLKKLYEKRLGRYQAAIALEPIDRMPIATGSNYFAEVFSGNTKQTTVYDPEKWLAAEVAFINAFPEIDVLQWQASTGISKQADDSLQVIPFFTGYPDFFALYAALDFCEYMIWKK